MGLQFWQKLALIYAVSVISRGVRQRWHAAGAAAKTGVPLFRMYGDYGIICPIIQEHKT